MQPLLFLLHPNNCIFDLFFFHYTVDSSDEMIGSYAANANVIEKKASSWITLLPLTFHLLLVLI
jgi:hypothetical protein